MRGLLKFLFVFAPALLVISASALTITAQPKATTVNAGSTATFKVVTTNGTPTAYQWFLGTSALQDGTASSGHDHFRFSNRNAYSRKRSDDS